MNQSNHSTTPRQHKNEVHIIGELAADPSIRTTSTGKQVANLTVITRSKQRNEFHRVVGWQGLAERASKLQKGDVVEVNGKLETRSWQDKDSGQKRYITEILAWDLLTGKEPVAVNAHGLGGVR